MWGETLGDVVSKRDGNMAITRQNWSVAYKTFWLKIKKDEHSQNPMHPQTQILFQELRCGVNFEKCIYKQSGLID